MEVVWVMEAILVMVWVTEAILVMVWVMEAILTIIIIIIMDMEAILTIITTIMGIIIIEDVSRFITKDTVVNLQNGSNPEAMSSGFYIV